MSEQKPPVDFNKYAGKIINAAEFEQRQKQTLLSRIGTGLKAVVMYPANLARAVKGYAKKDVVINAAEVYMTQEETKRTGVIIKAGDRFGRAEETYFEASKLMKLVAETGGESFLSSRFMAAIDSAPDHRDLLANGRLERSGYALNLKISSSAVKVSALPLPEGTTSLASVGMR